MNNTTNYKELVIWQKGMEIVQKCYCLTQDFPANELYKIVQQIRQTALSIPANIAKGYDRRYTNEYVKFLNISQGSVNKLESNLLLSEKGGLCNQQDIELILSLLTEESRMITSFIQTLDKSL